MSGSVTPLSMAVVEAMTLEPTAYVAAENVTHGDPAERGHTVHVSPDERFLVGVWAAEPYGETFPDGYPGDEFAHVLAGRLTLVDPDGTQRSFGPGDSYVMTKGWAGTFQVDASFTKYFVLYLG
jgi:uncharacterized cupin superfamily protein